MRSQIACLNECKITCICLTFHRCVLSNVSSNRLHESMLDAFYISPLCVFKCVLTVRIFWPIYRGHGRRSWRTIKSPFTLYKQIPKNPGILFSKIPGLWSTENPGIPLGPDQDRPGQIRANPPDITIGIARPANLTNLDDLHGITIGIGQFRNSCNVTIDNLHCLGGRTCWYIPVIGPLLP